MQFVIQNWYLFLALAVVLVLLVAAPLNQALRGIKSVPVNQAIRMVNHESAVIVDVREPDEFRSGHIPDSINIPLSTLRTRLSELEKFRSRPLVISCRTSQRSAKAAMMLQKHKFQSVHILAGGILAWQNENLPTQK
ncbi:MAG: rhodanese-like domain-containing protein [Gammaproteobacteria bacterium]|nr:rhodanese-like domain-containing protein [Gammaproteobacteria bacterium]